MADGLALEEDVAGVYQIGWDPNNRSFFTPQGCFVIPAGLPMGEGEERTGRWLFDLETGLNLERTHRLVL